MSFSVTWHLTFILLPSTHFKNNMFKSHFPQVFVLYCSSDCLLCVIYPKTVLGHFFHKAFISNTLFHHLSYLVFFVVIYVNIVICLPHS